MPDMTDALEEMVQETLGLLRKAQETESWGDASLWAAAPKSILATNPETSAGQSAQSWRITGE